MSAVWSFEWSRWLRSPAPWLLLGTMVLLTGFNFASSVDALLIFQESLSSDETLSTTRRAVLPLIALLGQLSLLIGALLGGLSYANEQRAASMALWQAAPVSRGTWVIARWFVLSSIGLFALLIILIWLASFALHAQLDWGHVTCALAGAWLCNAGAVATGMAVSAWVRKPLAAVTATFLLLAIFWLIDFAPLSRGVTDSALSWFSIAAQFRPFLNGELSLGAGAFFVVWVGAALLAAWLGLLIPPRRTLVIGVAIGLLGAWTLCAQISVSKDVTSFQRNSLSEQSLAVLAKVDRPIQALAFTDDDPRLRQTISRFVDRYTQINKNIVLQFVDPSSAMAVQLQRQYGLTGASQLLLRSQDRLERVGVLSEQAFSSAIQRIAQQQTFQIAYATGSGERDLLGQANFDLFNFGQMLSLRGAEIVPLDLVLTPVISTDIDLLILSQPREPWMPGIAGALRQFVANGGQVLWLDDPGAEPATGGLLDAVYGVEKLPGQLIDLAAGDKGLNDPRQIVLPTAGGNPPLQDLKQQILFPITAAIRHDQQASWQVVAEITTGEDTWTEVGDVMGRVGFDPDQGEHRGPLAIAYFLESSNNPEHRAVIFGDADFLSNQFLNNGGNLELGLRAVDWLLGEQQLIALVDIPAERINWSDKDWGWFGLLVIFLPSFILFFIAFAVWWRRRA